MSRHNQCKKKERFLIEKLRNLMMNCYRVRCHTLNMIIGFNLM